MNRPKPSGWNIGIFLALNVAGGALLLSWVLGGLPTRAVWDAIDVRFFVFNNGLLEEAGPYRLFAAIAASQIFRALIDVILVGAIIGLLLKESKPKRYRLLEQFVAAMFLFAIAIIGFREIGSVISREGPTLHFEDAVRLSEHRAWSIKDSTRHSFPSGQSTAALMVGVLFFYLMRESAPGRGLGLLGVAMALTLTVPRLLSGAHWLSDVIAGSGGLALIFAGWILGTPIVAACVPAVKIVSQFLSDRYAPPPHEQDEESQ